MLAPRFLDANIAPASPMADRWVAVPSATTPAPRPRPRNACGTSRAVVHDRQD